MFTLFKAETNMNKIIKLALVAVALCGLPAVAQNQDNTTCTQQQCNKGPECRQGKKDKGQRPDFFEGITLSETQQQALNQINAERKAQFEARRQEMKQNKKEGRRVVDSQKFNPNDERREYVNRVKSILSPEQYVVFLENIVFEQGAPNGPRKDMRLDRGRKGIKGNMGDRSQRGNRTAVSLDQTR